MGDDEPVDIVVRPVQKARMLAKAWLQAMEMDEDQIDEIGIEVKPEPVVSIEQPASRFSLPASVNREGRRKRK